MILFFISFLLVFASSYFITSVIAPKKSILGLIYLFLSAFSQLVLTFEFLSLFSAIKVPFVLALNTIFLMISAYIWNKKNRPLWSIEYSNFKQKLINSLKLDKSLMWLYVGFCTVILVSIFLSSFMPITNADAQAYHVSRSAFWVLNGSLSHFNIADIRNLCLPINSEILYSWVLLFVKKDFFVGCFAFVGYLLAIVSIFNIMGLIGICTRKRLWALFILTAFPSVMVQISGSETDIIIAGLISSSIFLFWWGAKNKENTPIFMAALAYALALGTKTPAFMAAPAVGLLLIWLSWSYYKKDFYKPIGKFVGFGLINFLIFSAYNYILNFLHFGNFMGSESFMQVSINYYGIKGMFANFIKYIFMFVDFTGFRWSDYIGLDILNFRNSILSSLNLADVKDGLYTISYGGANRTLLEPLMGAGVIGLITFIPAILTALIKPVFKKNNRKTILLFAFAIMFVINLFVMSYLLAFMVFSIRFVMFFIVISSPVLVYTYCKKNNFYKIITLIFAMFYLIGVSTHLWARPIHKIIPFMLETRSISEVRESAICKGFYVGAPVVTPICTLKYQIESEFSKKDRFLAYFHNAENIFTINNLQLKGYKIDFALLEDIKRTDLSNYDYIILPGDGQKSTYIKDYEKRKNEYVIIGSNIATNSKNTVPCVYLENPKAPNKDKIEYPPAVAHCVFTSVFVKEKRLKVVKIIGDIDNPKVAPKFIIYKIMH